MGRVEDIREMSEVVDLETKFLICGTLKAKLPYDKVELTRAKNRRLGLGLMGMHEWLIQKGEQYEVTTELHNWLAVYKGVSDKVSKATTDRLSISRPVANRAIAPTGSIGILAGSSTGIEPLFAVSYKRRYLRGFTFYPYGSRGGQPLTSVPYSEAVEKLGEEFDEHVETHDICDISGTGGTCGV